MTCVLSKTSGLVAAHCLPLVPAGHMCRRRPGRRAAGGGAGGGAVDPLSGWVMDYGEMSREVKEVLRPLDHNLLNAVAGLENPTSEMLAAWIWERLAPRLRGLHRVSILETCTSRCDYGGPEAGEAGSSAPC